MLTTSTSSCGWCSRQVSSSVKLITRLSIHAIFRTKPVSWTFWTILRYVLHAFLDELEAMVPPTIILMSPRGGLGWSFSLRVACSDGGSVLSLLTNLCNFPYLIRASICCFKSKHSYVSWPWSWWKRQYFSLDLLLGSPFSLPAMLRLLRHWFVSGLDRSGQSMGWSLQTSQ